MSTPRDEGFAGVAELPPYRSLLVVDMKDYSGSTGREQTDLTQEIPKIMAAAFTRCGLDTIWDRKTFHNSTGDGYAVGLPTEVLPFLLNPYLGALQRELEERNRHLSRSRALIRMRVSISVGPTTDSGENVLGDGSGPARVELHRLLDSTPVRELLSKSDENVTFVAAIVSSRAYEDAVLSGYADESESLYLQAPVEVKTYAGKAYLRVPKPSAGLLNAGFHRTAAAVPSADGADPAAALPGPGVQVNDHTGVRHGGVGTIVGGVGTFFNGASGPVHSGTGNQYIGDADRNDSK